MSGDTNDGGLRRPQIGSRRLPWLDDHLTAKWQSVSGVFYPTIPNCQIRLDKNDQTAQDAKIAKPNLERVWHICLVFDGFPCLGYNKNCGEFERIRPMSGKISPASFQVWLVKRLNCKWLYIGLGIKRWLVLLFVGVAALALGILCILIDLYPTARLPEYFYSLTLRLLDRDVRGLFLCVVGVVMILIAVARLSKSLTSALAPEDTDLVEVLYRKRARKKGPKIVALGGGTGLSTLLRGLKEHAAQLTAIVTVADDGGSSGRLRRELGVLPPGDFRQCIAALADSEPLMTSLLQYRFGSGSGLEGHSFGNLLIVAMAGITGSFERALRESSRVLAVRGQILPSTLRHVTLCAETRTPELERVAGESEITRRGARIVRVYLEPENTPAYPDAVRALLDADLIIAGPGSLYTSILPNLLVPDIQNALRAATAKKIYVCNIATQPGETDDFSVEDHFAALEQHVGAGIFTHILANDNYRVNFPDASPSQLVKPRTGAPRDRAIIFADLVDETKSWRHDPKKLAQVILNWHETRNT
ncbi:MAG: YvcK family protein [Chloroflexi bacterium]|nr:YvcK family protein [Chloroflexota bacterium]